jgi:hypothetical protein
MASIMALCSRRLTRRSSPVVHRGLIGQVGQALTRGRAVLDMVEPSGQPLSGRITVLVLFGDADEVLLTEPPFGLGAGGQR